jgi:hypothetical protein
MATLAAVGGRWLRENAGAPVPELLSANSSFQYVSRFTAEMPARGLLRRTSVANSPEEWLVALRAWGVSDLSLITSGPADGALPSLVASAFSSSGPWGLLATGGVAPTIWGIRWEVADRDAPDSRIWALAAVSAPGGAFHAPLVGPAEAREQLRVALAEIRTFAETNDLETWAPWFAKSATLLDDPEPVPPYHRDLLPSDASLSRRQLAAAVVQGWVFGGMGSWNDVGLADPEAEREYEHVGANMYSVLLVALPAAVNGS